MTVTPPFPVSTLGVPAEYVRGVVADSLLPGVIDPTSFAITTPASNKISIYPGWAVIPSSYGGGSYYVRSDAAIVRTTSPPASGNVRVDQVIAFVRDDTLDGSGYADWDIRLFTGGEVALAQSDPAELNYRSGAALDATLPASSIRLADLYVTTSGVTVCDRRPWARGAFVRQNITNAAGNGWTLGLAPLVSGFGNPFYIECQGILPLRLNLNCVLLEPSGGDKDILLYPVIDGVAADLAGTGPVAFRLALGEQRMLVMSWDLNVSAGRHKIVWNGISNPAGAFVIGNTASTYWYQCSIEELLNFEDSYNDF